MPLTTKICLNCCKTLQENGTSLYLCGNTFVENTGSLKYSTNQSASYTCLSVPHVGYVTGLTSSISTGLTNNYYNKTCINYYTGATDNRITALELVDNISITGATNGLTKVGQDVVLGGTLTGNTTINTLTNNLIVSGNTGLVLDINSTDISIGDYNGDGNHTISVNGSLSEMYQSGSGDAQITACSDGTAFISIVNNGVNLDVGLNTIAAPNKLVLNAVSGVTNSCITIGSNDIVVKSTSVSITGTTVNIGGTVLLTTAPFAGSTSDSVLVRANDGTVKTVAGSSLGDKNNIYSYSAVTSNVTLSTGSTYVILANPSAEFTITLPATPTNGQVFKIKDISGQALTYNVIISGNGKNIDGYPMARINTDYGAFELIYNGIAWYTLSFVN